MYKNDLETCAIVVIIFHTNPMEHELRLFNIAELGAKIFLVDNTPNEQCEQSLPIEANKNPRITHLQLGRNAGIAQALNIGIKAAFDADCQYVFTFDQDSEISNGLLLELLAQYQALERDGHILLSLGPHPINKDTGVSYLRRRDRIRAWLRGSWGNRVISTSEIITSGMLVNRVTYNFVGLYYEPLFIDFVDHDWCWRLRRQGGVCLVDLRTQLKHMVGDADVPYTFGMKHGAAFRLFFLFRNATFLILTGRMPYYDSIKFIALIPAKALIFLFMIDRKERWYQMSRGLLQGVRMAMRSHP